MSKHPKAVEEVKRATLDIREYLHKKGSVITIKNNDNLCLARALVVAIAKIEKDPSYSDLRDSKKRAQQNKAIALHERANVPFGPCGLAEVDLFQKYLTNYEINIVSGNHKQQHYIPTQTLHQQQRYTHLFTFTRQPLRCYYLYARFSKCNLLLS